MTNPGVARSPGRTGLAPHVPINFVLGITALCALPLLCDLAGFSFVVTNPPVLPSSATSQITPAILAHALLEGVAIIMALLSGALALSHYRISRKIIAPILGLSLLCAASMDLFHTLVSLRLVDTQTASNAMISFSWAVARIVSAVVLLVGLTLLMLTGRGHLSARMANLPYVLGLIFFLLGIGLIIALVRWPELPNTLFPERLLKHPLDVVPLLLNLAVGGLLLVRLLRRQGDVLAEALLVSLLPMLAAEIYMIFGSSALYDHYDFAAHGLKILSYSVPFVGLLLDHHYTYHLDTLKTNQLHQTYRELQERTHELLKSHRSLEESNRFKTEFLASVTHELRTPLNSVIGFSRVLLKSRSNEQSSKEHRAVEAIFRNSTHLLGVINDILDLSKIETGSITLEKSEFLLSDVIQEVFEMLEPLADKKQLTFQLLNYARNLRLVSDMAKLRQVLINLCSNAVKYTERGSVVICIERADHEELGEVVKISVRDTGIGIEESEKNKLFVEFSRTEAAINSGAEGTGLGLMISAKLVQVLGGAIDFDSEFGVGSEFRVCFPTALSATEQWTAQVEGDVLASGIRVVCGEPDPDTARYLEIAFDQEGVQAVSAPTPKALISLAEEHMPDVIFFDTGRGTFDQQLLLAQLAAHNLLKDIPKIAMSDNHDDERNALRNGADLFLAKPFNSEDLVERVRRLVYRDISSVVLIGVEDEHQERLAQCFDDMSVHTFFVADHRLAQEKLSQFLPDMVVVNLGNPRVESARLVVALTNDEHHARLPVILYNGLETDVLTRHDSLTRWEVREVEPTCFTLVDAFLGVRRRVRQRLMHIEDVNRRLQIEDVPDSGARTIQTPAKLPATNVLVVDAASDSSAIIGWLLQDMQLGHDLASGGRDALKRVLEKNYKLIFVALDLPDLRGREVVRRLRATNTYRNTPIVAINSDNETVSEKELQEIGFNNVIRKPIDGDRLLDVLSMYIELRVTS
ncbi:response regulator [Teredinibacter turnerae]|uniref:response regulator n=1 Tax=Teredinibacter turnerae TaxID=2426 RepID=UPI0003725246|nr:response regulator [Teredinibacter turnerae]